MGAPLTEFVIETILRDGLNELRISPTKFDDLFSRFKLTFFNNQYGQAKIDELKTYIQNNQIKIIHALQIQPTDMPCISIQLLSSDEVEDEQQFSNMLPEQVDPKVPNVIVPTVTPTAYDSITGKLNVADGANLGVICPGMIFKDASDVEFVIESGNSNISGNKFINIGKGKEPDLGGDGEIVSSIDFTVTDRRMVRLRETINLGCHAHDKVHLAKFLYYIVYYIIKSRQVAMEERGLHLDRGVASIFDREGEVGGEDIYTRYLQLHVLTEFDWDQEQVNLVDCFDVTVKAEENGVKFNTNTSE
jgi:hypothetical protein